MKNKFYFSKLNLKQKKVIFMATLQEFEIAIRTVKKHNGVDILCPRAERV